MVCAPVRPYIYYAMPRLLIKDLKKSEEWRETVTPPIMIKRCVDIKQEQASRDITNWVDRYGEFSADIVERYLKEFRKAGVTELIDFDCLHVYEKRGVEEELADKRIRAIPI
jgi:hypothetical protein